MRVKTFLFGLSFVLLPVLGASAHDPWTNHPEVRTSAYQVEVEQWHQERIAQLTRPDGYLSLVGLHWLSDSPRDFPGIGQAHLEGKDVLLKLAEGVTVDGKPVTEYRVGPDLPRGTPDFRSGTSHFFVIRHGPRVGLRVKDPNSTILKNFTSIERFPVDPEWRIVGRFQADPQTIPVPSVVEVSTDEVSPGYAVFERAGKSHKLRLMEGSEGTYFLVFSDGTAGQTTYSGCRFLDVEKGDGGELVLDFNKAENPPCSMTPYATCPLPPAGNILPFEVTAGEMHSPGVTH